MMLCVIAAIDYPFDDDEPELIPLTSGSVAEFYISPMLPCFGDIDVMYYLNNKLAIPAGYPPPTQLPDEFHNCVQVHEIIDSYFPGYVYLKKHYLLTLSMKGDREYSATPYDEQEYLTHAYPSNEFEIHGPAVAVAAMWPFSPYDRVMSVRCLSWPTQASDWPTRHRNYGWPDSATVSRIISDGCDVVAVAHKKCKQDIAMYRLSFSRAEIVLLNSWLPIQQIIYHMLRTFVKTEKLTEITDNTGSKIFSNYHIKTLMLWACELKPITWWTDDLRLVKICVELLHTLAAWLSHKCCQNYFVSNCNLMDVTCDTKATTIQLMPVSEPWLAVWFINNYIYKCAQMCPEYVSQLFDDVSTVGEIQYAVSAVVYWRSSQKFVDLRDAVCFAKWLITVHADLVPLSARSCVCWMTELPKIDKSLFPYFIAVAFLHVASKLGNNDRKKLFDILATTVGQCVGVRTQRYGSQHSSVLSLSKAAEFMKVVANNSCNTVQLILIEVSKEYLCRALRCTDSHTDLLYCLVNVYLGVLYYTAGQYQMVTDHCKLVLKSHDLSQCSSLQVVQGELLPRIDDGIDTALGLAVFYQYVKTAALNQQQHAKHVSVFTTELFAHYLLIKSLSATKNHQTSSTSSDGVQRYKKYLTDAPQLFTTDVLLHMSITSSIQLCFCDDERVKTRKRTSSETEPSTPKLVELLQQSAVEHLTAYRHLEAQQFYPFATIVTTDFEALYAYKRGDYQRCLQLSTQNIRRLTYVSRMSSVSTKPVFIQLLDDDIVSLTALTLIVNTDSRYCDNSLSALITQLTLSLYLMTQCQLKLRHSATSLAQTLDYIKIAQRKHTTRMTLDQLTLKLIGRKVMRHITKMTNRLSTR